MKFLFDCFPILVFFITYKFYGIYAATGVAIAGSLFQLIYIRVKNHRFESVPLITFFSILLLGGATIFLHNDIFIKWKPTILYWVLAILFLGTSIFGKKPLIQRFMENNISLPQPIWRRLNISWVGFCLLMGSVNLFVVYHYSTNTWVNFKLFGILGLTVMFGLVQSLYMAKYLNLKAEQK